MPKSIIRNTIILLVLIYVSTSFNSNLYSQTTESEQKKNYIELGLTFPLLRTFNFTYERMLNKNGFIRLNFCVQSPSNKDSYETNNYILFGTNNKRKVFTANSVFLGYGTYIIPKVGLYIAGGLSYRYKYFENKYHYECVGSNNDSKVSLESEYHNDYGTQSLVGIKLVLKKFEKMSFIVDFSGGLGFYISNQEIILTAESYGTCSNTTNIHYFSEPKVTNIKTVVPLFVLNANLGINF